MAFTAYLSTVYALARKLTQTSSTSLADADLLLLANETYLDVARRLADRGVDALGNIATTDLVLGQDDYALPTDCLSVVRVEVNYDDPTDELRWSKMTEVDVPNLPLEWYTFLSSTTKGTPYFDLFGGQIYVAPRADAARTAGLRLWYLRKPDDLVGSSPTTEALPYPFNMYYDVLGYGCAFRYFRPLNVESAATMKALYDSAFETMLSQLGLRSDEPIRPAMADSLSSGWI